jgi:alpha-D-ribose 1-methylphosphonate 5-triphosphate diphosphatase PhnM
MPGIIDLHSDALEKYIEPRPGTVFPMDIALQEFDKTLVSFGISTMYYCVAMVNIDNYGRDLQEHRNGHEDPRHPKRLSKSQG